MWAVRTMKHLHGVVVKKYIHGLGSLNVSFVGFFGGRKNVSVRRAGIDPITIWYINISLWSRRLLSNVSRLRLVSMVVTDPGCLD